MKKFTKKAVKAFTLVELVIVMAVFTILLAGAMALVDPVSKIMKKSSVSERTYSYLNTIQLYLEDSLKYSEDLWIYTAENIDEDHDDTVNNAELLKIVNNYKTLYYGDTVKYNKTSSDIDFIQGTIRVLRLENSNDGQISLYEYGFSSDKPILTAATPSNQLNEAYFDAVDSRYIFRYALGVNSLVNVDVAGESDSFAALSNDLNNVAGSVIHQDLSITLVAAKAGSMVSQTNAADGSEYIAFRQPCGLSVANLPLTNINSRGNVALSRPYWKKDPSDSTVYLRDADSKPVLAPQTGVMLPQAFTAKTDAASGDNVDLDQDIYFIYSYTDEIK